MIELVSLTLNTNPNPNSYHPFAYIIYFLSPILTMLTVNSCSMFHWFSVDNFDIDVLLEKECKE